MNTKRKLFIISILLNIFYIVSFGQTNENKTFYHMSVKADPASGIIECKAEIDNPPDSFFVLNKDMNIHRVSAGGKEISFHINPSNSMPNTMEVVINSGIPKELEIEYSGKIKPESFPPILSSVNMVKPELVELAIYVSWFPKFKQGSVSYELTADLPSNYLTVTNGELKEQRQENNRSITKWQSYSPGFDIVLLAAPDLKKTEITNNGTKVEIYYDKVPKTYVDSMKSNLIKSMNLLTKLLGSSNTKLVRVIYSPRTTWAYVRTPLIIVSQGNVLDWRSQKFGPARDFRTLTHEIAHYWWNMANMGTPEDWLNEGPTEYSAFLVSEKIMGKDFTDQLLKEYNKRASECKTETPIVQTDSNSPDREVNRYDKPTILFNELRKKYGKEKVNNFLKSLYKRFALTKDVTTPAFLDEMEKQIGKEAREYFENALFAKKWSQTEVSKN
jgi:roadblock/LC7 domain-containing protein